MAAIASPPTRELKAEKQQSKNFHRTGNMIVRGDNLETLKLLRQDHGSKVKCIYIDPPYNTEKDNFTFNDSFRAGGSGGRAGKHSGWLSFMYPRIALARDLLSVDGVVFVSIADNEAHNLRLILDEIFGEANYMGTLAWVATKSVTNSALLSQSHQYIIIFAKDRGHFKQHRERFRLPETGEGFKNPDNDHRGAWKADPFQVEGERPNQHYKITNPKTNQVFQPQPGSSWKNDHEKFRTLWAEGRIVFGLTGRGGPCRKRFLSEAMRKGRVAKTLWDDVGTSANGTAELQQVFGMRGVFRNPKPTSLVKRCLQLGTRGAPDSTILDFFAGSGTTAHAAMQLNKEEALNPSLRGSLPSLNL